VAHNAARATTVPVIVNNAPVLIEVPAPLSLRELTEIAAFCAMVPEDPLEVVTRLPLAVVSPTLTRGVVNVAGVVGDHRIEACVGPRRSCTRGPAQTLRHRSRQSQAPLKNARH